MKRIFSKIAVLMTLIIVGTYSISGTAFAQSTIAHPQPSKEHSVLVKGSKTIRRSGQDTVVFVHGFSAAAVPPSLQGKFAPLEDASTPDCSVYWGDALNFMNANHGAYTWGRKDFRTVQFYNRDINCSNGWDTTHSSDLHNSEYANRCTSYNSNPGADGTFNEDLYHVSCLFAWYIYDNFGQNPGWNVELVGHSMGGLIIHNAIYQVQNRQQLGTGNIFPPTLGHISDVVTLNTPHQGHTLSTLLGAACNVVLQCRQMNPNDKFTQEMNTPLARNSQAGGTDWTLIGSECDKMVSPQSATITWDVGHKVVYAYDNSVIGNGSCYDHGGIIHDTTGLGIYNSYQWWCDWQNAGAAACNIYYQSFPSGLNTGYYSLADMLLALWSDQF